MQQENPLTAQALEAERFRHFIVSVTDYAIYTLSPEGVVITWNAGAQRRATKSPWLVTLPKKPARVSLAPSP